MPTKVPLVPRPATKCVMRPAVCSQISLAVPPVGRVAVLIGIEIFFGIGGDHFFHFTDRAIGAFVAGSDDQFGSECAEDFLALMRSAVRQAQRDAVAERRANHGVSDAGIAAGGIDDAFAGRQLAGSEAGLDHAQGRAILDRASWIEPFRLSGKLDVWELLADPLQPEQGSVPDVIEDGVADAVGLALSGREWFGGGHGWA